MTPEKDRNEEKAVAATRTTRSQYEPPRVEKSRRLTEVTGQPTPVPSGTPVAD